MTPPPVESTAAWRSGDQPRLPETVLDECSITGDLQPLDAAVLLRLAQLAYKRAPYPGHGRAAAIWGLSVSCIRNAIARAELAGIIVTSTRGPGRPHRYVLHNPAREGQTPHNNPAPDAQPTLPAGGSYPALEEPTLLTTAVPTEGQAVERQRPTEGQPQRRTEADMLVADRIRDLVFYAHLNRPHQVDPTRMTAQLVALDLSLADVSITHRALVDQIHQVDIIGAWVCHVATTVRDSRLLKEGTHDAD